MKKIFLVLMISVLTGYQGFAQCSTSITGTFNSCASNCSGSVMFTSSTGTPPYNLIVTNGPSVQYSSSYTWANVCPGSYHYDITDATMSCHDTGTVVVTAISPVIPPALNIYALDIYGIPLQANPTICQFQTITFYVNAPFINVSPNIYTWKVNGTVMLTQNNLANYFSAEYTTSTLSSGDSVTLEVTWPNACMSPNPRVSQSMVFTLTPNQPPSIMVTDNSLSDTICFGSTITFTASPFDAGTPSYEWYLDGTPVGSASIYTTSTGLLPGNHTVYCCITSSEYCDSQDPIFNPTVCDTATFVVEVCLSVPEHNLLINPLAIYPNPVNDQITIYNTGFTVSEIEIYDVLGKKVVYQPVKDNIKQLTVNVSVLTAGIYFIEVRGEKDVLTGKFIKR